MLVGKPSVKESLQLAIDGETHEFTVMYPEFYEQAVKDGNYEAATEAKHQIEESEEHAEQFKAVLALAEKRFAALTKVEKRHAEAYQKILGGL